MKKRFSSSCPTVTRNQSGRRYAPSPLMIMPRSSSRVCKSFAETVPAGGENMTKLDWLGMTVHPISRSSREISSRPSRATRRLSRRNSSSASAARAASSASTFSENGRRTRHR